MTADAEIEKELRETLGGLLRRRCDIETVAALADGPESWDRRLWQELRGMGVPGLAVPEEYGGEGAGYSLAVAAQEELGRRLAPVPAVSVVAAQAALLAAGTDEAVRWLRRIMVEGMTVALAVGRSADGWSKDAGVRAEDGSTPSGHWMFHRCQGMDPDRNRPRCRRRTVRRRVPGRGGDSGRRRPVRGGTAETVCHDARRRPGPDPSPGRRRPDRLPRPTGRRPRRLRGGPAPPNGPRSSCSRRTPWASPPRP